ncbi:MAG TPA: hypothetical protein PK867_06355 [Pirellulales bacterium]|nr:hypothetical protein [Pirellulales bacterium]
MSEHYSFKFVDDELNRQLLALLKESNLRHSVAPDGTIRYLSKDEEVVGTELISAVRDRQFPSWQILSCPNDWLERYRAYMKEHQVPFTEEVMDGELCFLLPSRYRPHSWRLENGDARQLSRRSVAEATE